MLIKISISGGAARCIPGQSQYSHMYWRNLKVKIVKQNKLCIPTKIEKLEPQKSLSGPYFTTDLLHCISILGSVLNVKGLKAVQKFHFFKFIKFTLPNVVKAFRKTNVCSTIWGGRGVVLLRKSGHRLCTRTLEVPFFEFEYGHVW